VQQLDEISNKLAGDVVNARIARTGDAINREMKNRTPQNVRDTVDAADKEARAKRLAAGVRKRRKAQKDESYDAYNMILSYLIDEGYASTEDAADKIILNMSESWFEEIIQESESRERDQETYGMGGRPSGMRRPRKFQDPRYGSVSDEEWSHPDNPYNPRNKKKTGKPSRYGRR
jgi:hypothetical protein